jgi:LysR family transcriptional regulator, transcription activator of glutamate synthase operon
MDTDALRWFQQVADGVTVTEVSELEMVTQSGISRALTRLENEVGAPLLRRSGRTLRPTHAGSVFKHYVDAMLHRLDDGLAAVDQLVDPERGTVALAFQHSLGTWLVPDLVSSFRAQHPNVAFHLTQVRDQPLHSAVADGRVELEIGTGPRRLPTIAVSTLTVEPLWLGVARDHHLADAGRISLRDAANELFIGLRPTSVLRRQTDELCRQADFVPTVVFEGEDLSTVRGFVAAGLGVAVMPAPRTGSPDASAGAVRYLALTDAGAEREISLGWKNSPRLLPAAELFRKHVLARVVAGGLPALAAQPHAA